MAQFHETRMGQNFLANQLPQLIQQLTRIADALETANHFKKELTEFDTVAVLEETLEKFKLK